ncbi:MAG: hypothetical protein BWY21_00316 [Parcubacteria group bacterium ADurb.Bin216]|nr:MAG: hypothetical protein BWY21_00316 [Parcubacteria group bacterium ADurb.Bin216]
MTRRIVLRRKPHRKVWSVYQLRLLPELHNSFQGYCVEHMDNSMNKVLAGLMRLACEWKIDKRLIAKAIRDNEQAEAEFYGDRPGLDVKKPEQEGQEQEQESLSFSEHLNPDEHF